MKNNEQEKVAKKEDQTVEDLGSGYYKIDITKENLVAAYESTRKS